MTTESTVSTGPFAGIPVSDWVRDGAAALLLLVSLMLPWSFSTSSYGAQVFGFARIEVVLVTLLSLFSLAITYLARAGVFPASITVRTVWLLRLAANAPYAIVVLVHIVIDLASREGTGLGFAAAAGLAGAITAAQPREAEVRGLTGQDPVARLWHTIAIVYAGLAALTGLVAVIIAGIPSGYADGLVTAIAAVSALITAAAVVVPALFIVLRREQWRTAVIGLGAALALVILVDAATGFALSPLGVESIKAGGYLVVLFLPLVAIAASPGTRLAMAPIADLTRWFAVAALALVVGAAIAATGVLRAILHLALVGGYLGTTGLAVVTAILLVVVLAAAVVARAMLRGNPAASRWVVVGLAGAILLLGLIAAFVSMSLFGAVATLVLALGVPALVGYALLVPASVREYFATATPAATSSQYVAEVTGQPIATPAPAVVDPLAALAASPQATADQLFALARDHQHLWPLIAANPAAYDDLLDWLGSSADPGVQSALRARGR